MDEPHILDRLADAFDNDAGIVLTADDVAMILDEFSELEIGRMLDRGMFDAIIRELQGITPERAN